MFFQKLIGIEMNDHKISTINYREAVRAIIILNNKVLLIHSNKGDYKFPGGGIEKNENHSQAIIREVTEETGYLTCEMKEKVGIVIERKLDILNRNAYFQMTSHYYLCELVNHQKGSQKLDAYELEQEFMPKWIDIDEAIKENELFMTRSNCNDWIERETFVLKQIKHVILGN